MICHVVMWNLKDEAQGMGKVANAQLLKQRLQALSDHIPEIEKLEVGLNFNASDAACDIILVTHFQTVSDMKAYQEHPAHQELLAYVRNVVADRRVVDFEVD